MALGLLTCGRDLLPWTRSASISPSWVPDGRGLPANLPTDIRNKFDSVWAMTHAGERKHTTNLYWDTSGLGDRDLAASHVGRRTGRRHRGSRWIHGDVTARGLALVGRRLPTTPLTLTLSRLRRSRAPATDAGATVLVGPE
jgi:hypothetical protein